MGKFIFWFVIFIITFGLLLHFNVNVPYLSNYMGKLPGDFTINRGKLIIYFPVTSAAIFAFVLSMIIFLMSKKKKES